jgi:hypothetical protein
MMTPPLFSAGSTNIGSSESSRALLPAARCGCLRVRLVLELRRKSEGIVIRLMKQMARMAIGVRSRKIRMRGDDIVLGEKREYLSLWRTTMVGKNGAMADGGVV